MRISIFLMFTLSVLHPIKAREIETNLRKSSEEQALNEQCYTALLRKVQAEQNFESAYVYGYESNGDVRTIVAKVLQHKCQKPVLRKRTMEVFADKLHFNAEMLVVAYLGQENMWHILQEMAAMLDNKRQSRIIFSWQSDNNEIDQTLLHQFLQRCDHYNMLNVVLILGDFPYTGKLYSYQKFPRFAVEAFHFNAKKRVFRDRMRNLHGYAIRTLPDQLLPYTFLYKDEAGSWRVGGMLQKLFLLFARKLNATIEQRTEDLVPGKQTFSDPFLNLTQRGALDLAQTVSIFNAQFVTQYTYPALLVNWCLMTPVERDASLFEFLLQYFNLMRLVLFLLMTVLLSNLLLFSHKWWCRRKAVPYGMRLLDQVLHPAICSGLLGSSFGAYRCPTTTTRLVYFVVFFVSLMHGTEFGVELNAFLTKPMPVQPIRSLDDIAAAHLQVLIYEKVAASLIATQHPVFLAYHHVFKLVSGVEFLRQLESFNANYAYIMHSARWQIVDAHQRLFTRPIFRLSNTCFIRSHYAGLIVAPNSVYRQALDEIVGTTSELGLLQYWTQFIFYDLVAAGKLHLVDVSWRAQKVTLNVEDFYAVWTIWAGCLAVSGIAFVAELCYYRFWVRRCTNV